MAKWLHLQLNGGKNQQGDQVIWNEVLQETHKARNLVKQTDSTKIYKRPIIPVTYDHSRYSLGWRIGYYRGMLFGYAFSVSIANITFTS